MATVYYRRGLLGGTPTDLDQVLSTALVHDDFAFTCVGDKIYAHVYDENSSATESSPDVIQPDDVPASGRWILQESPFDVSAGVEVGDVIAKFTETVPVGYLECNGAAINRTTYSGLFAVIGVIAGAGDGTNTFNIPDLRGEFLRGWDHTAGNDPDASSRTVMNTGGVTGDQVGSVQGSMYASHGHNLGYNFTTNWPSSSTKLASGTEYGITHRTATQTSGGNETRPRNATVMFCIKY